MQIELSEKSLKKMALRLHSALPDVHFEVDRPGKKPQRVVGRRAAHELVARVIRGCSHEELLALIRADETRAQAAAAAVPATVATQSAPVMPAGWPVDFAECVRKPGDWQKLLAALDKLVEPFLQAAGGDKFATDEDLEEAIDEEICNLYDELPTEEARLLDRCASAKLTSDVASDILSDPDEHCCTAAGLAIEVGRRLIAHFLKKLWAGDPRLVEGAGGEIWRDTERQRVRLVSELQATIEPRYLKQIAEALPGIDAADVLDFAGNLMTARLGRPERCWRMAPGVPETAGKGGDDRTELLTVVLEALRLVGAFDDRDQLRQLAASMDLDSIQVAALALRCAQASQEPGETPVSALLDRVFGCEIENERHGGDAPTTLGSTRDSIRQGLLQEMGLENEEIMAVEAELDRLIGRFGLDEPAHKF